MSNEEIIRVVLDELKERGFLKEDRKSAYARTEALLYSYNRLKEAINSSKREIEELEKYGLPKKSKSVVSLAGGSSAPKEPEYVKIEERIDYLSQSIYRTNLIIEKVNLLLAEHENPRYPSLIKMIYFDGRTREDIADFYRCDVATVSRNKTKIINELKVVLFPNDTINELGC